MLAGGVALSPSGNVARPVDSNMNCAEALATQQIAAKKRFFFIVSSIVCVTTIFDAH